MLTMGLLLASGCGDNPSGDDEVGTAETSSTTSNDGATEAGTSTADSAESGSDSGSDATDAPTTTNDDNADEGPQTKFDIGIVPDTGFMNCQDGGGDAEFSYLWAANSSQGTISKLETATVTEVGRYIVRPDSNGSPSRTSVSLSGNVAVANRSGGVAKIYANPDHCDESNGMPGLQTSNSSAFLPWGQEECLAWYTPFGYQSQRPVAWTRGDFNQGTCTYDNEKVWTSGNNQNGQIDILLLNGDDGSVEDMVSIPTGPNTLDDDYYGIYGGAVDGDDNFWGSQLGGERMVKVNRADLSYEIVYTPGYGGWYGMTVDVDGMVWLCGYEAARYDPMSQSWATAQVGGSAGCMADANENGLLWMGGGPSVVGVDRETLAVVKTCAADSYGISIDFEGYVWAVAYGSTATKIDPETCQTWSYNGLVGAYTYSDMTGYALSNAGTPSG
ncbi:hypothetical protein ACNOYE_03485 [Nannocystaceae bacterium ST9]